MTIWNWLPVMHFNQSILLVEITNYNGHINNILLVNVTRIHWVGSTKNINWLK